MRWNVFILAWLLCPCLAVATGGVFPDEAGLSREPVHVQSERLEAEGDLNRVAFFGEVVARQGDLIIYADELTVTYAPEEKAMQRAEARGHVRVVRGDQVATAEHAVYDSLAETITLTGDPRVRQGESYLVGSAITIYLRDRRSVVHGAEGGRVNAVFAPEKGEK